MVKIFEYSDILSETVTETVTVNEAVTVNETKTDLMKQLHDYGFILVRGVPGIVEAIHRFRESAKEFIGLENTDKTKCTPENYFSYGWSYGEEIFNGQRDSFKGSYYADLPENDQNVWPDFETPVFDPHKFKTNYLNLGLLVSETGKKILASIGYGLSDYQIKMRMLHYGAVTTDNDDASPNWCGLHRDHGQFTGLIPDLYLKNGVETNKVPNSGLYIRDEAVTIPEDCIAFQVGETLELISNGEVCATEHYVRKAYGYDRLTFATFITPLDHYVIDSTNTSNDRYRPGITFKEFGDASYAKYYKK